MTPAPVAFCVLFLLSAGCARAGALATRYGEYRAREKDTWQALNTGDRGQIATSGAARRAAEEAMFRQLETWITSPGDSSDVSPAVEAVLLARRRGKDDLLRRAMPALTARIAAGDPDHGLVWLVAGDLAETSRRDADAVAAYRRAADDSLFTARGQAGMRLAARLVAGEDTASARRAMEKVAAIDPPSSRANEARLWIAEWDLRQGRAGAALERAVALAGATLPGESGSRALLLLARAYRATGKSDAARKAYVELFRNAVSSEAARTGWKEFKALTAGTAMTAVELRAGAQVLFKAGDSEEALKRLASVPKAKGGSAEATAAAEDVALWYYSQKNWQLCRQAYDSMKQRALNAKDRGRARVGIGRCLRNMGQVESMEKAYGALRADTTDVETAARGAWELAREYKALGRFEDSETALGYYIDHFPYGEDILKALELRGVIRLILNRPNEAEVDFKALLRRANRTAEKEEAAYWMARAALGRGDSTAAGETLRAALINDIPDGLYGYRVRDLLTRISPPDTVSFWYPNPRFDPARDELHPAGLPDIPLRPRLHFQRGVALARAGFMKEAQEELNDGARFSEDDPTYLDVTASMAARLDMYLFAMTTARRALAKTNSSDARARLWRYVYALGHYDLIGPAAETNGLDPMLVSALIRQESLFDPRAVSRVGARGLMQLMLPTARQVARSRSEPAPTADDLFRPEISVRYGTHYLREKLVEFGDRVDVALSAYNAGESKAGEWASLLTNYDPDLFRELIDYSETKDYVRRVQYNRATFHLFYDPRPRSQ